MDTDRVLFAVGAELGINYMYFRLKIVTDRMFSLNLILTTFITPLFFRTNQKVAGSIPDGVAGIFQ